MLVHLVACGSAEHEPEDAAGRITGLIRDGKYKDAENEARAQVETARRAKGADSIEAAGAIDLLVESLWRGGKAGDRATRELADAAISIKEGHLPAGDPRIAASLNNLGNLQRLIGQPKDAGATFERAVAIREKALGPAHPDVAQSLTGLGAVRLDLGDRDGAQALFEKALAIREKALGADSIEAAQSLNNLAAVARIKGDVQGARARLERVVSIWEKKLRPDHPHLGQALENLAVALRDSGEPAKARPLLERALAIKERGLGPEHPAVAQTLETLGNLLRTLGQPEAAEPLVARSLAIQEKLNGPDHPGVAASLLTLGNLRLDQGDAAGAATLLERALSIRQARFGADHPDTADALNDLAIAKLRSGKPAEAVALHTRALGIRRKALAPDDPAIAASLNNLANAKLDLGDLIEADRLFAQALEMRERRSGAADPDVAETLNNLGYLRSLEGDLPGAKELLERALAIRRAASSSNRLQLGETLHNLGEVMVDLGDFEAARPLLDEALAIRRETLGPEHPEVARTLNTLGNLEFLSGATPAAATRYEQALAIREKSLGPRHIETSESLCNIGVVRLVAGDLDGARERFTRALEIREGTYGPSHPQVALVLDDLAETAMRGGDAKGALALRQRARASWEKSVGPDHVALVDTYEGIAAARRALGDWTNAVDAECHAERLARERIRLSAGRLAERRARGYAAATRRGLDIALSAAAAGRAPERTRAILDALIRSRAIVLDAQIAARREAERLADPTAEGLRERLVAARSRLAALVLRPPDRASLASWRALVRQARDEAERSEEAFFARQEPGMRPRREPGLDDVAAALPEGTALAAYARYRTSGSEADAYLAWILPRRGGKPIVVPLGPATAIDGAVHAWRRAIDGARGALPGKQLAAEASYREEATRLRAAVWDPIAARVSGIRTVLVVPDGDLALLSFATLPATGDAYLAERGPTFHYLSTERDVTELPRRSQAGAGMLIVAAPEFGEAERSTATRAEERGLLFGPLPGTRAEAEAIKSAWAGGRAHPSEPRVLSGAEASESAVKQAIGGYEIVHFATHGFILGSTDPSGVFESNPLVRAGIALAGANGIKHGGGARGDDGLLTAEEIAALDLSHVDWAVLSACETGIGTIDAAEGVLGMRRAFQLAGARTVVMSLWPVEDASVSAWMRRLYEARASGATTIESCRRASVETIEALRKSGRSTHPYAWGPFVAYGDWR